MGRLTKEPEIRFTAAQTPVASFTLAVDRRVSKGKEPETDFIPVIAWRGVAEFASNYIHKGQRVAVVGSIHVRSYTDKDNIKRYVTEIVADNIYFADGKINAPAANTAAETPYCQPPQSENGFVEVDDNQDLPF